MQDIRLMTLKLSYRINLNFQRELFTLQEHLAIKIYTTLFKQTRIAYDNKNQKHNIAALKI